MLRRLALVLLLALPAHAWATEPMVVALDWRAGTFLAGGPAAVEGVTSATFDVTLDACHRDLKLDLLYDPHETEASVDGVGEAALLHTFRAQVLTNGTLARAATVTRPGYGVPLGPIPAGDHQLRIALAQGAGVSWQVRLRAWEMPFEPECLPRLAVAEVEANPPGPDADAEWVEVVNLESVEVDASGWSVAAGAVEVFLPGGSLLAPGARLVVALPGEALDDAGAAVELRRLSVVRDRTPDLADGADDARAWHRGEPWTFAPATPGA